MLATYDDEAEIVETAAAFQKALRAGDFSLLWLSGSLSDLSAHLQEEVRAAVLRGASLVVDGAADTHLRAIAEIWAAMPISRCLTLALQLGTNALPLTNPSWALVADAPATTELRYASGETAAVRSSYGKGQVLAMGFDSLGEPLSGTEWTAWLQAQMVLSTPKLVDPMLAQSSVYLKTVIHNGDDKARQLTLSTALGNGAQLLSSKPAAAQSGDQLSWPMDLAAGAEQGVELWLQLPADAKAFSLESQLRNTADAVVVDSWSHNPAHHAQQQAEANARTALPAIAGLADAEKAQLVALFDQAADAVQQQKLGDAIAALLQAQEKLRALPQGGGRDAAWQPVAQWIGLVSAAWKDDGSATKSWTLAISSGNQQVAQIGTAFATPLQVRLADENGAPVAGQTLRFTAPASGASALFSNGTAALQVSTDAQGLASADAITANASWVPTKCLPVVDGGVNTPASFDLRNSDAATPHLDLAAGGGR
ncbi:hypothetical protein [Comamonas sp. JC664]|uniref:hypothetical protein n=1 Tax=Comamonas sp. JC664 TaxID=2801917 RepID=UPI003605C433